MEDKIQVGGMRKMGEIEEWVNLPEKEREIGQEKGEENIGGRGKEEGEEKEVKWGCGRAGGQRTGRRNENVRGR